MNSEFPPFAEIEIICKFLLEKCAHIRVLTSHQQEGELGRGQGAACSSFDSDFTISEMHYKSIFHQLIQQLTDNRSCRFHFYIDECQRTWNKARFTMSSSSSDIKESIIPPTSSVFSLQFLRRHKVNVALFN